MASFSSRYDQGVVTIIHKGKKVTTSVGSIADNSIVSNSREPFTVGRVPVPHEHRPDLISDLFYGSPDRWWTILQFNGFTDPFEDLPVGKYIKIPYR